MHMDVGFLIDRLTALMMVVVTFVSLCVHVYTIGYMADDPGYQRFFAYISLFTFSMLMLVMANNFMQLFFGWEAVGVVSYLLIGFWYTRPTAIFADLKAFLVNRIGDFGFILGIAGIVYYTNSMSYTDAFAAAPKIAQAMTAHDVSLRGGGAHADLHLSVHWCHGQIGAGSAARLVAGLHGRPDPDLGTHPRGDDGDRGHFHGGAHVAAVRALRDCVVVRARHRCHDRVLHGTARYREQRHQAGRRVLDSFAARVHDGGAGRLGLQRGRFSTS